MKSVVKRIVKKTLGYKEFVAGTYEEENFSLALKELVSNHPELVAKKATAGCRDDGKEFYPDVKKIADAFSFFNDTLYEYGDTSIPNIGEYDGLHSGTPMQYKPYKDAVNTLRYLEFDKYLYRYPATIGSLSARGAFVDYLHREGFSLDKRDDYDGLSINNVAFTCSTTQAFSLILKLIGRAEDVIIMTGPNYGLFAIEPERLNMRVVNLNLKEENNFFVNPLELNELIVKTNKELEDKFRGKLDYIPKVVAFLNMNPHNPIGNVMSKKHIDLISKIGDVCLEEGVFVIDDLIYRDLTFDQDNLALPMAMIPKYFNNTISLYGISKAYGLAGFRAGVIVAPIPIIKGLSSLIFQYMDSIPVLQVKAMSAAFNGSDRRYNNTFKYFKGLIKEYKYRLELFKGLVNGVDNVDDVFKKDIISDIKKYAKNDYDVIKDGIKDVEIRNNTMPESGFFAILDFTKLKGKKGRYGIIKTEYDLLKHFYNVGKIKYIMGVSMAWPYEEELVGRVNFALSKQALISNYIIIAKAVNELE